ncbi:MAG: hypothetical protein AB1778_02210 [Candidatus Bipolaricaulota bacterium]
MSCLRGVLLQLRDAFAAGGVARLAATHANARRACFAYRLLYGTLNLLLPLTPLFAIVEALERDVGDVGVHKAACAALARPPVPWRVAMPMTSEREIRTAPAVFYGRHGSVLTPLLLAAALDRADLRMVAASYIAKLGPNIASVSFPVFAASRISMRRAGREGIVPRLLGWIAGKADADVLRETARGRNRTALDLAAAHVSAGGAVLIAPDSRDRREAWRIGLGVLLATLAQAPASSSVILVPWRITGASVQGIFQLLSRNPLLRALGRFRFRHPVRVALGVPMPLLALIQRTGTDPRTITAYLEERYTSLPF